MATLMTATPLVKKRKMSDDVVMTPADASLSVDTAAATRGDSSRCGCKATGCGASISPQDTAAPTQAPPDAAVPTPTDTLAAPAAAAVAAPVSAPAPAPAYKTTFHRRVLPQECVAFSSVEGRRLFTEAISTTSSNNDSSSTNYMQIYFPLAEQFTTQAEPAFCGLATLAMCLNALHIDPGRIWKGAWRWFSEELLDCCTPLEIAKEKGISFDQFVCLARCNGALADGVRADNALTLEQFREIIKRSCATSDEIVVLNYTRKVLEQTGDGHFSPIGGYNEASDMVLLLDVARFKYPPHWVRLPLVFEAIQRVDQSSGLPRGLMVLKENTEMTSGVTPANQIIVDRTSGEPSPSTLLQTPQSCCLNNGAGSATSCSSSAAVVAAGSASGVVAGASTSDQH